MAVDGDRTEADAERECFLEWIERADGAQQRTPRREDHPAVGAVGPQPGRSVEARVVGDAGDVRVESFVVAAARQPSELRHGERALLGVHAARVEERERGRAAGERLPKTSDACRPGSRARRFPRLFAASLRRSSQRVRQRRRPPDSSNRQRANPRSGERDLCPGELGANSCREDVAFAIDERLQGRQRRPCPGPEQRQRRGQVGERRGRMRVCADGREALERHDVVACPQARRSPQRGARELRREDRQRPAMRARRPRRHSGCGRSRAPRARRGLPQPAVPRFRSRRVCRRAGAPRRWFRVRRTAATARRACRRAVSQPLARAGSRRRPKRRCASRRAAGQ